LYFIPVQFSREGTRKANDVISISCFVIDIDTGDISNEQIKEKLSGLKYLAYSSYSHTPKKPRWRVIIPYSEAIVPCEHKNIYYHFQKLFGGNLDDRCSTLNQLWFTPACPSDAVGQYEFFVGEGDFLDAHSIVPPAPIEVVPVVLEISAPVPPALTIVKASSAYDSDRLNSALDAIPSDDYTQWIKVGLALFNSIGQDGFELWIRWSSKSGKFDYASATKTWHGFRSATADRQLKLGTIFHIAKEYGWSEPIKVKGTALVETLTDTGNAERFAKRYGGEVKYVHDWGKFIIFNGHYWQVDNVNQVMELAKQVARAIDDEADMVDDLKLRSDISKHSVKTQQLSRLKAMIELTQSISSMIMSSAELNKDDWLLCVKNGVVDLRYGRFREGRSEDFITQVAPVTFDSEAKCPRFLQFLNETFVGSDADSSSSISEYVTLAEREELIDYMQKSLGYALTGKTGEQCLFFAYGTGANGKTTLINLMLDLLGNDYAMQTPMDTLMVKPGGNSSSNHLARLQGIRFVASTEVEDGAKVSESLIKQMTGGDKIAARFLYKEFVEFTPKFKLFIAGNHKPIIKGGDFGIWRRIHLIPFEITISTDQRDATLPEQLKSELSGILNWLILGCVKWRGEKLKVPKLVEKAVSEYQKEMDTLGLWLDDCCCKVSGYRVSASEAFKSYQSWTISNAFHTSSSQAFYRKLAERFPKKRDKKGNYFSGIFLK
jgi:putative DNA primase/helicase